MTRGPAGENGTPRTPAGPQRSAGERSEPGRSGGPAGVAHAGGGPDGPRAAPDPEVSEKARRRHFTAEFKREVLAEADACTQPGEVGALLRRRGLYSSHLSIWRRQREDGGLAGLAPRTRGRKPAPKNPLADEVTRLERENLRLLARAERAERLVDLQKKVAELLGDPLPPPPPEMEPLPQPPPARTRRRR